MTATISRTVELPKWAELLVVGEPVGPGLAYDIIFRTCRLSRTYCNDEKWMRGFHKLIYGIDMPEHLANPTLDDYFMDVYETKLGKTTDKFTNAEWEKVYADCTSLRMKLDAKIKPLDIDWISNDQLASCYIYGPKGWVDWNGVVGNEGNTYNLGKRPTVEGILRDWKLIARTYPQLTLRAWVFSHQHDSVLEEGDTADDIVGPLRDVNNVLVEFLVHNGKATLVHPDPTDKELITAFNAPSEKKLCGDEVGIRIERLTEVWHRYCRNRKIKTK